MDGEILYKGKTKLGKEYLFRYPRKEDAESLCEYINGISKEKTFIRFQGEEILLEDERKYLFDQLDRINNKMSVQLFIESDGMILGNSSVDMKDRTESHEGVFGISIAKEIRGEGIGKNLMELVIKEAEVKLTQLKIITLGVFGDNNLALKFYPKLGFKEFGRLPGGAKHNGDYVDHIYMYKKIR